VQFWYESVALLEIYLLRECGWLASTCFDSVFGALCMYNCSMMLKLRCLCTVPEIYILQEYGNLRVSGKILDRDSNVNLLVFQPVASLYTD
jgi:hypothetical protein